VLHYEWYQTTLSHAVARGQHFAVAQKPGDARDRWCVCMMAVKLWTTSKRQRGVGLLAAGLMLLLWLGTLALATSPDLHRLFHTDAKNPNHQCLITQLQKHPLLAGFAPVVAPVVSPSGAAVICRPDFQILPATNCRLSPSRGPPSVISSFPVAG
jgi:hypothetical protein